MKKTISALALAGAFLIVGTNSAYAYEVKAGDTMSKIAERHNMSLEELSKLNPNVTDIDFILIGQNLNTNNNDTQKVIKVHTSTKVNTNVKSNPNVSNYELDLLARLVRAEAQSEPYAGKVAVAKVVLNRVESSQFPDTIEGVIYQSGQFSPVSNGSIKKVADSESIKAVKEALNSSRDNTLYFYNPETASSRWLDSKPTIKAIGNHVFK